MLSSVTHSGAINKGRRVFLRPAGSVIRYASKLRDSLPVLHITSDITHPGVDCYYLGHHKCASVWVRQFIRRVCQVIGYNYVVYGGNQSHNIISRFRRHTFHLYVNSTPEIMNLMPKNARGFHVIRDPRDVLISDYYSRRDTHSVDTLYKREMREYLKQHDLEQGLLYMLDHCTFYQQIQGWKLGARSNILDIKYEDLILNEREIFGQILNHLGISIPEQKLDAIVDECSFKSVSGGREPGQENTQSHLRKGVSGDWKNYMEEGVLVYEAFYKRYGYLVDDLGYRW